MTDVTGAAAFRGAAAGSSPRRHFALWPAQGPGNGPRRPWRQGRRSGLPAGIMSHDADAFKVAEGAAYALAASVLDDRMDDLIQRIGVAQEKDRYLYAVRTLDPTAGTAHAEGLTRGSHAAASHALCSAGPTYEADAAHYPATGKRTFLDAAWADGDTAAIARPMPARRVRRHAAAENRGRVALMRGPLPRGIATGNNEQPGTDIQGAADGALEAIAAPARPSGAVTLAGRSSAAAFTAMPYRLWAHRGSGPMTVRRRPCA